MEQQAFGRVYRMSQTKETHLGRIMVRNTIDMRLAQLQLSKLKMIDRSIKDHDPSNMTFTAEEIASLLGRIVQDEQGAIIAIEDDYEDGSEMDGDGGNSGGSDLGSVYEGPSGEESESEVERD